MPYIVIVIVLLLLAAFIYLSALPEIDTEEEDEKLAIANSKKTSILQCQHLLLGVLTLFLYVGVEVIAGDSIISYGASQGIALTTAKFFTTFTLISMIVGYIIGILTMPKFIKQENALKFSAILGVLLSLIVVFTKGYVSVFFVALLGLANSLMWPAIWPLAIAGLGRFTKIGASLLIMAIAGGAIMPLLYGYMVDKLNPSHAYFIMIPSYLFIFYYSKWGHKVRIT